MDSYEYYLLYHKDSIEFINEISATNEEILIALEKLLTNQKIKFGTERESCFEALWSFIQNDSQASDKLIRTFEGLLTLEQFEKVKFYINKSLLSAEKSSDGLGVNVLRIIKAVTRGFISNPLSESFFKDAAGKLLGLLFLRDDHHIVDVLHFMMNRNQQVRDFILDAAFAKSQERVTNVSLTSLCYFFEKMCERGVPEDQSRTLSNYFNHPDRSVKKQGIFLIKTLLHHKIFQREDEDSFRKFTVVVEALEENQSHLILPTLSLVREIKFSERYANFWFILCRMVFTHENTLVKFWGLKHVLNVEDVRFDGEEIISILKALNSTSLFGADESSLGGDALKDFVGRNLVAVFTNLIEVEWMASPFYRVLEMISSCLTMHRNFDYDFIRILQQQTKTIHKRVKNLVIRSGVQQLYAAIADMAAKNVGIKPLLPVLVNIHNMTNRRKCLEDSFLNATPDDYEFIFTDEHPEGFIKSALLVIFNDKPLKDLKEATARLAERDKVVMEVMCKLNDREQLREDEIASLIYESIENLFTNVMLGDDAKFMRNVELLELGLRSKKSPIDAEVQEHILELLSQFHDGSLSYWIIRRVAMEFCDGFDWSSIGDDFFNVEAVKIQCQSVFLLHRGTNEAALFKFLLNIETIVDEQMELALQLLEGFKPDGWNTIWSSKELLEASMRVVNKLLTVMMCNDHKTEMLNRLTTLLLTTVELERAPHDWIGFVASTMESILRQSSGSAKAKIFREILKPVKILRGENSFRQFVRRILIEKVVETEMMTLEQQ